MSKADGGPGQLHGPDELARDPLPLAPGALPPQAQQVAEQRRPVRIVVPELVIVAGADVRSVGQQEPQLVPGARVSAGDPAADRAGRCGQHQRYIQVHLVAGEDLQVEVDRRPRTAACSAG